MDIDKARKVAQLLSNLDTITEIEEAMEKEKSHWWGFITPDIKRWDSDGKMMPDVLREEFAEAVKRAKTKIHIEIADY